MPLTLLGLQVCPTMPGCTHFLKEGNTETHKPAITLLLKTEFLPLFLSFFTSLPLFFHPFLPGLEENYFFLK
jgi:hypothetical protein